MNQNHPATPQDQPAPEACAQKAGEWLAELGRVYLEAGLPFAAALEAALADSLFFDFGCPCQR